MESEESGYSSNNDKRYERINHSENIDCKYGFLRHRTSEDKVGWLINFQSVGFYLF